MVRSRYTPPPPPEPREFCSVEEIDSGIAKLQRRIKELEQLDINAAVLKNSGQDEVVTSNIRERSERFLVLIRPNLMNTSISDFGRAVCVLV